MCVFLKWKKLAVVSLIGLPAIIWCSPIKLNAQQGNLKLQDNKIYAINATDTPPAYPGGIIKLYTFLKQNIKYPHTAAKAKKQGYVHVSFIVEKDGSLHYFKIEKSIGFGTGKELIRVLSKGRRWNPAMKDGRPVRVKREIPFKFSLAIKEPATAIEIANASDLQKYIKPNKTPLFLVDGSYITEEKFKAIKFNEFLKVEIITDPEITTLHEIKSAKNGIVIARTKAAEKRFIENIRKH